MPDKPRALLIGNSDGIGLAVTRKLLDRGYTVFGISRSPCPIPHRLATFIQADVTHPDYEPLLRTTLDAMGGCELAIYCAGIGEPLNLTRLEAERAVFDVNLSAAVLTTTIVLQTMLMQSRGHFIGLSSLADALVSANAPSYTASKAGISRFWEGLALALRNTPVHVTNVRFGYVDTKMAKAPSRPFMMSAGKAAEYILEAVKKPRIRLTRPRVMIPVVALLGLAARLRILVQPPY